jgi:hypothetical protein
MPCLRTKKQGNYTIQDEANPEIDQQAKVGQQTIAAVLRDWWQIRHDEEINHVPQYHRSQRDKKVSR